MYTSYQTLVVYLLCLKVSDLRVYRPITNVQCLKLSQVEKRQIDDWQRYVQQPIQMKANCPEADGTDLLTEEKVEEYVKCSDMQWC